MSAEIFMEVDDDERDWRCAMVQAAQDTATVEVSFRAVMADITSPKWAKQVKVVQTAYAKGGKDAAAEPKKKLPGVLFSGTFERRSASALIQHSGLICADLDELGTQLEAIFETVASDPHTLACFRSPTGSGLKVVMRVDPAKPHAESFRAAEHYILEHFGLQIDQACKDVSRICFVSHDPEAFVAADSTPLPYPPPAKEFTPSGLNPRSGLELTPGDDYDNRGDFAALLTTHGWSKCPGGWTRPGKTTGLSATFDKVPGRFYIFSSSVAGFEPNHVYRPWHVYAILEHGGDFAAAARELGKKGFGHQRPLTRQEENMERIAGPAPAPKELPSVRPITSYAYPSDDDPNMLLGSEDYLGRGGGLLFVSHAGAGKSSWAMDACMMWALGRAWMQIKSHQPRKTLIVQAEDSDRYIGKIFASFAHVNQITPADLELLTKNCVIVRLKGVSGPAFFTALTTLVQEHQPDLVVINPIYLYAEGDITRSEYAQPFLLGLDAVNKGEKFAYILIHHTGKPAAKGNNGKRAEVEDWESAYMGFGSSYLANWPRATILLEPVSGSPGSYQIKLGKGGFNAGVTKQVEQGAGFREEPVTRIAVRHSRDRMVVNGKDRPVFYWEIDPAGVEQEESPAKRGASKARETIRRFASKFPRTAATATPIGHIHRSVKDLTDLTYNGFKKVILKAHEDRYVSMVERPGLGPCFYLPDEN